MRIRSRAAAEYKMRTASGNTCLRISLRKNGQGK
jgi:hypothetical protein